MLTFSTNDNNILGGETIYTNMGCHGSNVCLFLYFMSTGCQLTWEKRISL